MPPTYGGTYSPNAKPVTAGGNIPHPINAPPSAPAPASKNPSGLMWSLLIGGGAAGLSFLFGKGNSNQNAGGAGTAEAASQSGATPATNVFENAPTLVPLPEAPPMINLPLLGVGGMQDLLKPQLTGTQNTLMKWNNIPIIYAHWAKGDGKGIKVYPQICGEVITERNGDDQWMNLLLTFGYGEVVMSDLKIGDQPIDEISGIEYEFCPGTTSDDPITLYTQDIAEEQMAEKLTLGVEAVRQAPQPATELTVEVTFDNGLYASDGLGNYYIQQAGITVAHRLANTNDDWEYVPSISRADTTTAVVRAYQTWEVPEGLYDIQLVLATPLGYPVNEGVNWTITRAKKEGEPVLLDRFKTREGEPYGMSLLAIRVKATNETYGVLNQISARVARKLPQYDHLTDTWGAPEVSDNPADVLADILCGPGNRRALRYDELDGPAFKILHDACDGKRSFNAIYETATTVGQACRDVCSRGRAIMFVKDGLISLTPDAVRTTVVQHFTPHNIIADSFSAQQVIPEVPHGLRVSFIDPNADWEQNERNVYLDAYDDTTASDYQALDLFGCIDRDEAYQDGRYWLGVAEHRRTQYSFSVDIENLACTRGDMIRFTHDGALIGQGSALVVSVTADGGGDVTGMTLSEPFEMEAGRLYGIQGRRVDGEVFEADVTNTNSTTRAITFITPIPAADAPDVDDLIAFGEKDRESIELIVESIEYLADDQCRISAIEHARAVYSADTGPIPPFDSGAFIPRDINAIVPPPQIRNVRSDETVLVRESDGSWGTRIQVSLDPAPPQVLLAEAQVRRTGGTNWSASQFLSISNGAVYVRDVQDGVAYDVRLRYRTIHNTYSGWSMEQNHTVIGKTTPPPDIPKVSVIVNPGTGEYEALVHYDAQYGVTVPRDFAGIRAKGNFDINQNYEAGFVIADLLLGTKLNLTQLPRRQMTLMFKAVDTAGNESINAANLVVNGGDLAIENTLYSVEYAPTWEECTITGGTVTGGIVEANEEAAAPFWGSDTQKFWGSSEFFWHSVYEPIEILAPFKVPIDVDEPFNLRFNYEVVADWWIVEIKSDSSPFWDGDTSDFWGSDLALFWPAASNIFTPVPQEVRGDHQQFMLRIRALSRADLRAHVDLLDVFAVGPGVEYRVDDYDVPIGGGPLPVPGSLFRGVTQVRHWLQFDASNPTAARIVTLDKDPTGPRVQVFDASDPGVDVGGRIDAVVRGYR